MRALRARRQGLAEREIRMTVPDARRDEVRERVADAIARLDPVSEAEALAWIEAVSDFESAPGSDGWTGGMSVA
jgi:hypothetical protein